MPLRLDGKINSKVLRHSRKGGGSREWSFMSLDKLFKVDNEGGVKFRILDIIMFRCKIKKLFVHYKKNFWTAFARNSSLLSKII